MAATSIAGDTAPAAPVQKPMTPPTSEEGDKNKAGSTQSELSDLELDDDDEEDDIEPDHYYDDGKIPVFKPTMDQFRSFKKFVARIDHHGMKSGIVKVIPPQEWMDSLPALDQAVKTVRVKNPITQEFSGLHGTFTQANIEKQRSYNLPQWKALTEEPQHQPPARRGERRRNHDKTVRLQAAKAKAADVDSESARKRRKPGRKSKRATRAKVEDDADSEEDSVEESTIQVPRTPVSPKPQPSAPAKTKGRPKSTGSPKPRGRQPKTVAERRKYNRQDLAEEVDEAAFEDFDYRFPEREEFTAERCQELENLYWKSLTFAPPMYGADMPGSLFDDKTTSWNVAHLENLLDVLGQKVPGVNTAYLYLGMWKASYAWHLEDVDLYSINYIHFGAPKQWYSISQADARRFEAAMRDVWPNDAKNCSQFLRHKTYLISPSLLESKYKIKVNKLVHNEGEFVITFPYGYHSGYNLGYNCAESVNFATESWLDYGRIAKKCDCEADSVWIDVGEIERKLRGEPTPEYYEYTEDEGDLEDATELPSPPASIAGKGKKRKRAATATVVPRKVKKIKIRLRTSTYEPCVLCPNNIPSLELLETHTGKLAHEICAQYTKETSIQEDDSGTKVVQGLHLIDKARLELKCNFCRSKKGACFQCSDQKCFRAFHATCAAAAGVAVNYGPTPVLYMPDGTEYYQVQHDFRCRFHRPKRAKTLNFEILEYNAIIRKYLNGCRDGDIIQLQYIGADIFAGIIVEKRPGEQTVIVKVLPEGDVVEVEYKYVLAPDLEESKQPKPSAQAKELPLELLSKSEESSSMALGPPQPDDHFVENCKWAEYSCEAPPKNEAQVKIDFSKTNQIWHYMGRYSTDVKPQYTEDPKKQQHNLSSNFLETVRPTVKQVPTIPRKPSVTTQPTGPNSHALSGVGISGYRAPNQTGLARPNAWKPRPENMPLSSQTGQRKSVTGPITYQKVPSQTTNNQMTYRAPYATVSGTEQRWSAQSPSTSRPLTSHDGHRGQRSVQNSGSIDYTQKLNRRVSESMQHAAAVHQRPPPPSSLAKPDPGHPPVQRQAPVANMMAPTANMIPSKSEIRNKPMPLDVSNDLDFLTRIQKYPYLRNAFLRRPRVYRSPYPDKEEFSDPYAKIVNEQHQPSMEEERSPYTHKPSSWQPQVSTAQKLPAPYTRPVPQNFYPSPIAQTGYLPPSPYSEDAQYQTANVFRGPVNREACGMKNDHGFARPGSATMGQQNQNDASGRFAMPSPAMHGSSGMGMDFECVGGSGQSVGGVKQEIDRGSTASEGNGLFANPPGCV